MQIGFTYIGTIVGAGFASGQEILTFFTRYGKVGTLGVLLSCLIFVWLGTRLMLLAHDIGARSYEDLNRHLFGDAIGRWVSLFTLVVLFGITTVMLAGAGSIFREHLGLPFQAGLWVTLILTYLIAMNGVKGLLGVNTVVVPVMAAFSALIVHLTLRSGSAASFLELPGPANWLRAGISPFMYAAFNLSLAQAVLVPIGAEIRDRAAIRVGGWVGGIGIGLMLMAGHFALAARMPEIGRFEIPMGHIVQTLGPYVQMIYAGVIFAEIFTTFLANVYGITVQIESRVRWPRSAIVLLLLAACYAISHIGFKTLLSTLYPLFGLISMLWFSLVVSRKPSV